MSPPRTRYHLLFARATRPSTRRCARPPEGRLSHVSRLAFLGCLAGVAIVACAAQRGSAGSEPSPLATALPVVLPSASIAPASARSASVAPAPAPPASPTVDNELPPFTLEVYRNTRFDFSIGVPSFFTASPPPKNGFGQERRWGDRATMTST